MTKNILLEGWENTSFGDIADIGTGNPAPQGEQFFDNGIYPFVRVQDMGRQGVNKYMIDAADHINQLAIKKMRLFPKGTVLFTKSGASSLLNQRAILNQSTKIPLLPIQEQKRIIQSIESRFSVCDKMEETIENSLNQAESLRQSILKQAFEGKLTEQWRQEHLDLIFGEHSAEALLKKIKAEKEALQYKQKRGV